MRFNKEMLFSKGKKKINGVLFRVDIVQTFDEGNNWSAETRNHSGGYLDIVGGTLYRIECSGGSGSSSTSAAYTASKPYVGIPCLEGIDIQRNMRLFIGEPFPIMKPF